jgi:sugar phosphate isomerase/epimerase
MSYPNSTGSPLEPAEWRHEAARRIRELAEIAEGEGIILGHENCSGYGGTKEGFLQLVEEVDHSSFKLIFDTGNNTLHEKSGEATWDYYEACRDEIVHVHIKAAIAGEDGEYSTCFVDEDPIQARILGDLQTRGYDGWLSIEPHLAAAIHAGQDIDDSGHARKVWVDYASRLEQLVAATS